MTERRNLTSSLTTLRRLREREVVLMTRDVALCHEQTDRIVEQIDRLVAYRLEYQQGYEQGYSSIPVVYRDRQLFLQRLDDTVAMLRQSLIDMERQTESAVSKLQLAVQKSAALGAALDQIVLDEHQAKQLLDQAQCDEQGRIAMASRGRVLPYD